MAMKRPSDPDVTPLGKYQRSAVALWQGASDHPDGPLTAWVTATPPPERMTICETQDPELMGGMRGTSWPRAGTTMSNCPVAPESVTEEIDPCTVRLVLLVSKSKPGST
jgi:hypothetical protein